MNILCLVLETSSVQLTLHASLHILHAYFCHLQVELPGCKGIWSVYHKSTRSHNADSSKLADDDDDEYHAYLIISLEARTMVISFLTLEDLFSLRCYCFVYEADSYSSPLLFVSHSILFYYNLNSPAN